jgi:hypothetical protein
MTEKLPPNPKDIAGSSKPDLSLIPPVANVHEARAMMDGAGKYGAYNWRDQPVQALTYAAAAMRHIGQWIDGEERDPVSGVHHLGHARACLGILLDAIECEMLIDNRPRPGKVGDAIRRETLPTAVMYKAKDAAVTIVTEQLSPRDAEIEHVSVLQRDMKIGEKSPVFWHGEDIELHRTDEGWWRAGRLEIWGTGGTARDALNSVARFLCCPVTE